MKPKPSSTAPLSDAEAIELAAVSGERLDALIASAGMCRDLAWGYDLTYSPKVFLPLTNVCRDHCDYCSFRRSPGDDGEWTMSPDEVLSCLKQASSQGCVEALFCLGDSPDVFPSYRNTLAKWGMDDTVDYLFKAAEWALELGLLPHTNAGILTYDQMARLRRVNVSLGLMLENVSPRLCKRGMPHYRAPDKRPERRLAMTREAGELRIPFTSGLLLGIGETCLERVETLLAIRELHLAYGHIQEVIIQNFRAGLKTPMCDAEEPDDDAVVRSVALARLILPSEVSVQAPPNLNPGVTEKLIAAGVNDFGGISPVTPDYINPGHPWPHIDRLSRQCEASGYVLRPRLPIYDDYLARPDFMDASLNPYCLKARARTEHQPTSGARRAPGPS